MTNINFNLINFVKSFYKINKIFKYSSNFELIFFGRSNTGKSSLLNALANKKIAFTSKKPGSTKLINLFQENKTNLNIFDFPGYGYSKFSNQPKKKYEKNIIKYFKMREKFLIGVIILIDIRRNNLQYFDKLIINTAIKKNISFLILLNKSDKITSNLKRKKIDEFIQLTKKVFNKKIQVELFSLIKKTGIKKLKSKINQWYLMKS